MKNKKEVDWDRTGLAIPGFLLIGIGAGIYTGNTAAFTLIGLGLGFAVAFFFSKRK